jgi:enoyl reductase
MSAVSRLTRGALTLSAAVAVALAPSMAFAGGIGGGGGGTKSNGTPPPDTTTGGRKDDKTISALAGVQFDRSKNGTGPRSGPVTPVSNWRPPACWYAPKYDSEGAAQDFLGYDRSPNHTGMEDAEWIRNRYVRGHPYTNFNLDKQGKGYWWTAFYDDRRLAEPGANDCTQPPFWVDTGAPPPPVKNAVTPEVLAQLAYAEIRIPQGEASTNPDGTLTVNLPTWVWLDEATFHPVSVRVYVTVLDIEATTTATPVALHIDPGTPDATVHPASGDCPIDAEGHIGTPYVKGATGDPPCGVTYLRSSEANGGPYPLKATVTWKISWTGTGRPTPVALEDGTFGTPQDVEVREIQTVNR